MLDVLNQIIEDGINKDLIQKYTTISTASDDSIVTVDNHPMINFGSCSYLGLEKDHRLIQGTIEAVQKYGTQFSSSRTYLSHGLYKSLEDHLEMMFSQPVIAMASTTLGHLATIPVVVGDNDAVILDLQVHSSIQMTVKQLKAKGITISIIKHNCMDSLEKKIKHLSAKHEKIWYFADGVYSMYGDCAPFEALDKLLARYSKFHLYVDDAHGMGWSGKYGTGVAFNKLTNKEKIVFAISMNKSFASAGGCIVFPNDEMRKRVRNCGATYIFSGPIQPPMLGAAVASAQLHLSEDLTDMQQKLKQRIQLTNQLLHDFHLPQFKQTDTPLFFIPTGLPDLCYNIISRMKAAGFFLNTASFPAVPMRKSGIRFMVTNLVKPLEIHQMIEKLSTIYYDELQRHGKSVEEVVKLFGITDFKPRNFSQTQTNNQTKSLKVKLAETIDELDALEWNQKFSDASMLTHSNWAMLESVFNQNKEKENNWKFYLPNKRRFQSSYTAMPHHTDDCQR